MERRVMMVASAESTRLLVTEGPHEVLKALLPPGSHRRADAAAVLLEGLARWFEEPLSVALAADAAGHWSSLGLCNEAGAGEKSVFYEVELVDRRLLRRGRTLGGVGDFRDVRQLRLWCAR